MHRSPPIERTDLAEVLLASADTGDAEVEISPEWREEIARRSAEYERGEVKGKPWEQVLDEIRRTYEGSGSS